MARGTDVAKFDAAEYPVLAGSAEPVMLAVRENIAEGDMSVFDLDRLKIPTGGMTSWEVPTLEGTEVAKAVQGIVVHWRTVRAFWEGAFEGGNEPPECRSPNGDDGYGHPGDELGNKTACHRCPNAQWDSDPRGTGGQACKLMRQLFLLLPGQALPAMMVLPPTSVRACRQFFLKLSSHGLVYRHAVIEVSLEKVKSGGGIDYAEARFKVAERLGEADRRKIDEYAELLRPMLDEMPIVDPSTGRDVDQAGEPREDVEFGPIEGS